MVLYTVGIYRESVESVYLPFVRFFFLRRKCILRFPDVRDDLDSSDMSGSSQHFAIHSASQILEQRFQNDHTTSSRQTLSAHCSSARASQLSAPSRNETD